MQLISAAFFFSFLTGSMARQSEHFIMVIFKVTEERLMSLNSKTPPRLAERKKVLVFHEIA